MARLMAPRLRVDPTLCDGAGYCAELVPELISLDEWGFPVVDTSPIEDEGRLAHARKAVAICPRLALLLDHRPDRRILPTSAPPGV